MWLAVLLLVIRAGLRSEPHCRVLAGAVVGSGRYNKLLIVVLLAALAVGLLIVGPRRERISRPVLLGLGLAVLIGLPNVVYQLVNGLPQLEFGRQLSAANAVDVRVQMWLLLALLLGPPLTVVWLVGLRAMWNRPPVRLVAASLPVLLVLVFALGFCHGPIGGWATVWPAAQA